MLGWNLATSIRCVTMLERLRKPTALIIIGATRLAYGCPIEEYLAFQAAVTSSPSFVVHSLSC